MRFSDPLAATVSWSLYDIFERNIFKQPLVAPVAVLETTNVEPRIIEFPAGKRNSLPLKNSISRTAQLDSITDESSSKDKKKILKTNRQDKLISLLEKSHEKRNKHTTNFNVLIEKILSVSDKSEIEELREAQENTQKKIDSIESIIKRLLKMFD